MNKLKCFQLPALILSLTLVVIASACAPAAPAGPLPTPSVFYRDPTYAQITPGAHKVVGDLSTVIEVPPFPYGTPLPPALPSVLDGLYIRTIPMEGTPFPCKRCAGYRLEGGVWSLYLDKGILKVFQQDTDFEAIASFTVSGDHFTVFNDPYCEEDITMAGTYTWQKVEDTLTLHVISDRCAIGLRAKNLTATVWTKKPDPCQPPNLEAAVSGHWKMPPECVTQLTPTPQ